MVEIDVEQVDQVFGQDVRDDRAERERNDERQKSIHQRADQVHPHDETRPAADGFQDSDLVGLLGDQVGNRVEDQDRADHHADDGQQFLHLGNGIEVQASPVLVGVLILKRCHADILFGQFLLDRRGYFLGIVRAVRCHTHVKGAEPAIGDPEALHALAVHEEEGQVHELGRRHEGMAEQPRDGEGALLFVDLDDHGIANADMQELCSHPLQADFILCGGPPAVAQLEQCILLFLVIIPHLHHALPPFVSRSELVQDVDRIERLYILDTRYLPEGKNCVPLNDLIQIYVDVGRQDGTMRGIHVGE